MTYSSALFVDPPATDVAPPSPPHRTRHRADLVPAQRRKIDRLLDQAGVGAGTRVLEIGTGWGELAIRAAQRGATVHSVTLSSEQQALARRADRGGRLADRVDRRAAATTARSTGAVRRRRVASR